jgi:hypothetical protein
MIHGWIATGKPVAQTGLTFGLDHQTTTMRNWNPFRKTGHPSPSASGQTFPLTPQRRDKAATLLLGSEST